MVALQARHGGVWKDAEPYVKRSGSWEQPEEVWAKEAGVWTKVWPSIVPFALTQVGSGWAATAIFNASVTCTGAQDGDLLIGAITYVAQQVTPATPSGWTSLYSNSSAYVRFVAKIVTSGNVTLSSNGSGVAVVGFRPTAPISGFTAQNFKAQSTTGNPTAQSISSGSGDVPLIAVAVAAADGGTPNFTGVSPSFDDTIYASGSADRIRYGWKHYGASPADMSVDMNDFGRNTLASGYVEVTGPP